MDSGASVDASACLLAASVSNLASILKEFWKNTHFSASSFVLMFFNSDIMDVAYGPAAKRVRRAAATALSTA